MFVAAESDPLSKSIFEICKKSKGGLPMIVSRLMHSMTKKIHDIGDVGSSDGEINELAN